jgi:hypothetical protein
MSDRIDEIRERLARQVRHETPDRIDCLYLLAEVDRLKAAIVKADMDYCVAHKNALKYWCRLTTAEARLALADEVANAAGHPEIARALQFANENESPPYFYEEYTKNLQQALAAYKAAKP